jgi:hypothetical protein
MAKWVKVDKDDYDELRQKATENNALRDIINQLKANSLKMEADAEKWRAIPREAQLLPPLNRADAELGALVRKMPEDHYLVNRYQEGWCVCSRGGMPPSVLVFATPEEALRAALKETE